MNEQDVFNKVWNHFKEKDWKQSIDGETCLYRSPDGNKCAAGIFIKDEFYSFEIELKDVKEADVRDALEKSGFPGNLLQFLSLLQRVHDSSADLKSSLMNFAKMNDLTIPD